MEARFELGRSPARAFVIGMAITVLVMLSALGGYTFRLVTASAPAQVVMKATTPSAPQTGVPADRWYLDQDTTAPVHEGR